MDSIVFKNEIGTNLGNLLRKGIIAFGMKVGKSTRPDSIFLKLVDHQVIKIKSILVESPDWDDIGTLQFSLGEEIADLYLIDVAWENIKNIEVLTIKEASLTCQCGLKIYNGEGNVIFIAPSSMPYSIELKAHFYDGSFEPECDLQDYSLCSFNY